MRRMLLVLAVAAAMVMAATLPAWADTGGTPNQNACFGYTTSQNSQNGSTPPQASQSLGFGSTEEYQHFARIFDVECKFK